jgi:hypothetical protein
VRTSSALLTAAVVAVVGGVASCASAPVYRPVGPPMGDRGFEGGLGVHGVVAQDVVGGGSVAWMSGQVAKDIFVVGRGHVTNVLPWDGRTGGTIQVGGAGGLRGMYALRPELLIGAELDVDYLQLTSAADGTNQMFVSGVFSFPVAEKAFENAWVYTQPTIGAGYRFGDVDAPFAGFTEIPIGFAWQLQPWLVVVGEGGLCIPFSGGYFGVGAALRL